jgi:hypothetical protein
MDRSVLSIVLIVLLGLAAGCGESPAPSAGDAGTSASTAQLPAHGNPADAVRAFLDAVRVGDEAKAGGMLTPLARKRTAEHDLVVAPPGSPTAKFTVDGVEMIADDGAHVASTWSDVDETGQPHTDAIVWMLRKESEGWRIAGMATKIFQDELPLLLNFEDPEDMIRKQQLASEEMQRRATAQQQKAAVPPAPGATKRY